MSSRTRDLARILGKTEASNTTNAALTVGGETPALDVFDTLDSLPLTGIDEGQRAFVEENSRLYISNGSGWYNISLVNQTPTWATEPDASYSIADSATPLVITALATDSDNPDKNLLNQSVVTDSAQYMVSITNDSSVWTFTPKSADSIGQEVAAGNLVDSDGDFIYTFKWSDGVSFVAKPVTISYSPSGSAGGNPTATGFWSVTRNHSGYNGSPNWNHATSMRQAPDGSYYMTGYTNYIQEGGFLIKFDEDGDVVWAKKHHSNGGNQSRMLAFDGNNPIVISTNYTWGNNYPSYSPSIMGLQKFDTSGNRTWSKYFRSNTISGNGYSTGSYSHYIAKDAYGNFWAPFYYTLNQDSPVNYTESVVGLMKFNPDGTLGGSYLLPPSSSNPRCIQQDLIASADGTALYLAFTTYDPAATSYPHGNVSKFNVSSSGVLTYAWTKSYGMNYGGYHYDVPTHLMQSSDGNLIVAGNQAQVGVSGYRPSIMKLSDTDGSFMWKKLYDQTYGDNDVVYAIDNNDQIYMYTSTYDNNTSTYVFYLRTVDASDGSHIDIWELDYDGQANASVDNSGSYSWTQWRTSVPRQGMFRNKDGNVCLSLIPNGNGFDYRCCFAKFPSTMITGTFGGGTGTYSGNLVISDKNVTPTDVTYNAVDQTYASFSIINDVGSSYSMENHYSGSQDENVSTLTVVDEQGVIE